MYKNAGRAATLLKALSFPGLIGGLAYYKYRTNRLANDPIYKMEDIVEKMYQRGIEKRKKVPISKPVYNVSDFDTQMQRSLI